MGDHIDDRGAEIITSAQRVNQTAQELMLMLPTLERALELATAAGGRDRPVRPGSSTASWRRSGAAAATGPKTGED